MTLKRKTFFWLGTFLLFLILGAYGYYLFNKPHPSAADAAVAFTITADSLFVQYQDDEHAADQRYLNKVIMVSGKLNEIKHSGSSEIWILSAQSSAPGGGVGSSPGGGINCQLFPGDKMPSSRPKPGDLVTIKGRCTGFLMDVDLADCVPQ